MTDKQAETITIPGRDQADARFKWHVDQLYADTAAWEADFELSRPDPERGAAFEGRLHEGYQVMLDFLHWSEESSRRLEKLGLYAAMRRDEDNGNAEFQALADRITALEVAYAQAVAWFAPEVLELDPAQLEDYLSHPELAVYRRMFDDITRQRPHTLSPAEEKLLAGSAEMANGFVTAYSMFTNADLQFPDVTNEDGRREQLTAGNFIRLLRCRDKAVREEAFTAKYATLGKYLNTISALYGSSVKKDNYYATAAHFPSALAASLFSDNVEESVYHSLIESVRRHLPAHQRYLELRRRCLQLDTLNMCDVYVPLYAEPKRDYGWEQGQEIVLTALAPLGEDYVNDLRAGLKNGWADVYENRGKTSGAYSTGCFDSEPYMLLNYNNDLNSVFTLAHEAGHSMHSLYSRRSQPYVYADYRIFVAEVASTVNENLLVRHLLKQAQSAEERAYLLNHYLEEFRTTVIRQTMFAEFELATHNAAAAGQPLTAESLCGMYDALNSAYFAPAVAHDDLIANEWARIPHFYRAYYVYKYATGFAAAAALATGLLDEDEAKRTDNRRRYLEFLSGGSSKDPLDLLAAAGVDLRTPQPVEAAFAMFEEMLSELEKAES